jgi:hypothetical protein
MTKARLVSIACLLTAPLTAVSCSSESPPAEHTSSAVSAIVKGIDSDASQDATVLVMRYDALTKGGAAASGCTGSLLTPRLVLTARHCVATTDPAAACSSDGKPIVGGAVEHDHEPSSIYVFAGKDRPDFIAGTARPAKGKEILSTGAKTLCDNDIALVLLDRPLEGGKIAPIRLESKPTKGEIVTVVGWGIADDDPNPPTRRQRTGVEVVEVGPAEGLPPTEFRIAEGTCQGDSGGPAIAASGAVLGALSRGGNGTDGIGADACLGGTNIFTSAAGHADFIRAGYAKAGQEPWLEGQPNPLLAKVGELCGADTDCRTNVCDTERKSCAEECSSRACAEGFACVAQGARKVCAPSEHDDDDGGCAVSPKPREDVPWESGALTVFALATIFASARRKK